MPEGESMFRYHGFSGPCPKPMKPPGSEPMTLIERLRNPQRQNDGRLDEQQTLKTMGEAADVLDGFDALRKAKAATR